KDNKSFYRFGFYGNVYWDRLDITGVYQYAHDDVFLGTATAGDQPLPPGARSPTWNTFTIEGHYTYTPRLIFMGRYELVRMSQQPLAESSSDLGNVDVFTISCRFYPIMNARAGFSWHNEFSSLRSRLTSASGQDQRSNSFFSGLDFIF